MWSFDFSNCLFSHAISTFFVEKNVELVIRLRLENRINKIVYSFTCTFSLARKGSGILKLLRMTSGAFFLRALNMALSLWTINDEKILKEFMKKEVLNITTRNTSIALRVRAAMA